MRQAIFAGAILTFGALTSGGLTSPALAQAPAPAANGAQAPKPRTSQFGDWVLICRQGRGPTAGQENCEIMQTYNLQGQSAPFAQIAIGRVSAKDPFNVTVVVPHNVSFPSTVNITTDDKGANPLTLNWTRCLATGCFASAEFKDPAMKTWHGLSQKGRIAFKSATGQDVALPLSFNGLGNALDALMKK